MAATISGEAAERCLAELVARHCSGHADLLAALRDRLRRLMPGAVEILYDYGDGLAISYAPSDKGYEGVLVLRSHAEGLRLYVNRAAERGDVQPLHKVRRGQAQYLRIDGPEMVDRPEIADLLRAAIALADPPFRAGAAGRVILSPALAKGRARALSLKAAKA
jgi:hypothetical protein